MRGPTEGTSGRPSLRVLASGVVGGHGVAWMVPGAEVSGGDDRASTWLGGTTRLRDNQRRLSIVRCDAGLPGKHARGLERTHGSCATAMAAAISASKGNGSYGSNQSTGGTGGVAGGSLWLHGSAQSRPGWLEELDAASMAFGGRRSRGRRRRWFWAPRDEPVALDDGEDEGLSRRTTQLGFGGIFGRVSGEGRPWVRLGSIDSSEWDRAREESGMPGLLTASRGL